MPSETRDGLSQSAPVLLAWGESSGDGAEGSVLDGVLMWAAGGAGLLVWTGAVLWLTG